MSTITDEGRKVALDRPEPRLLPTAGDTSHLIAASKSWGPFVEGDRVSVALTEEGYIAAGGATVAATSNDVLLPAGVHDFTVPTGVTRVALVSTVAFARGAVWKS